MVCILVTLEILVTLLVLNCLLISGHQMRGLSVTTLKYFDLLSVAITDRITLDKGLWRNYFCGV